MVLEVGDDDITAVTGVGDDGDDEEVAGGSGDVVASGAPTHVSHYRNMKTKLEMDSNGRL
ncbi:hypothetical protein C0Q70_01406 [Pomacea canaliculata]|uniref:Uncharacterized protein n=1 Tax=Pomacea canaliculata TaxID=400727 RepID=A0A2T7PZD2_POMCA|nr:hypothetical protein C0Q70_01406 [Pomacea canaliculata]